MPSSAPRIQSRPSTSSSASGGPSIQSRPMAPRPSTSKPQISSRPPLNANTSASSRVPIPRPSSSSGPIQNTASATASASTSTSSPAARPPPPSRASSTVSTPASSSSAAPILIKGKDTSSSAGKIFAKPSKEWVLPERAKPGRKVSVEEPDNKRQSQNRLSQRAHRARRTDYIQTLEERLRQYEADEIHSNVRLQEVARALKADNERLKDEVNALRTRCMEYNGEKDVWELERRGMRDALRELRTEVEALRAGRGMETIVRMEVDQNTIDSLVPGPSPSLHRRPSLAHSHHSQTQNQTQHQHSMSVIASTQTQKRDLVDCPICPNPDPDCPCQQGSPSTNQQNVFRQDFTLASQPAPSGCGLCHSTDECLCRVVEEDIKPDISSPGVSSPTKSFKSMLDDGCGLCAGGGFCACRAASDTPSTGSGSGMATIKAVSLSSNVATSGVVKASTVAAAMPLRLRSKNSSSNGGVVKPSIWALNNATAPASPKTNEAVCTGDPSNCDACKNDSFGREFCQHLFEDGTGEGQGEGSSGEKKSCTNCSGNCMSIKSLLSPSTSTDQTSASASASTSTGSSTRIVTPPSASNAMLSMAMDDDIPPLAPLQMACCGNPDLCGGHSGTGCTGEIVALSGSPSASTSHSRLASGSTSTMSFDKPVVHLNMPAHEHDDHPTLRPDQAWKQLKAHPNAKFASLALLADVVARRTTVLNPSPSPMPMPTSPALSATPAARTSPSVSAGAGDRLRASGSRPPVSNGSASGPGLGKKRNFELETSAVRDALKLLDRATPVSSPVPPSRDEVERDLKRRRV